MGHLGILEASHHMGDGVDLADIGEELVARPLPFGRAAHEASNVHKGKARRNDRG